MGGQNGLELSPHIFSQSFSAPSLTHSSTSLALPWGWRLVFLVGLFLQHEFSYDAYHRDIDRIHRVMRLVHPSGGGLPYYPLGTQDQVGPTLINELPEIEDMTHFITRPMWAGP